ncbi:hypothetical protein BGM26_19505 [Bacillus sp. FJAT-29790]|uniref:hypothetical protein n=1 Tax=Bacillus sp. FJAT-29790 TaxID=1895002 RepID=UPI001C24A8E0|nr:hypothetical protein [Bacillus sp. FJAT-29790]MBU8881113.1 hypothetical protein [Bacillus sp. FJAT-29790]
MNISEISNPKRLGHSGRNSLFITEKTGWCSMMRMEQNGLEPLPFDQIGQSGYSRF